MLIDHAALKLWLIGELDPISDSEPDVLADYVLVLLEKDQPDEELQHSCKESLAELLKEETKGFVDRLFDTLHTDSYRTASGAEEADDAVADDSVFVSSDQPLSRSAADDSDDEDEDDDNYKRRRKPSAQNAPEAEAKRPRHANAVAPSMLHGASKGGPTVRHGTHPGKGAHPGKGGGPPMRPQMLNQMQQVMCAAANGMRPGMMQPGMHPRMLPPGMHPGMVPGMMPGMMSGMMPGMMPGMGGCPGRPQMMGGGARPGMMPGMMGCGGMLQGGCASVGGCAGGGCGGCAGGGGGAGAPGMMGAMRGAPPGMMMPGMMQMSGMNFCGGGLPRGSGRGGSGSSCAGGGGGGRCGGGGCGGGGGGASSRPVESAEARAQREAMDDSIRQLQASVDAEQSALI
jgi:RNA-binding protein 26